MRGAGFRSNLPVELRAGDVDGEEVTLGESLELMDGHFSLEDGGETAGRVREADGCENGGVVELPS